MLVVEKQNEEIEARKNLDEFEVGDGIYDTVTHKLYILAHDFEGSNQVPGHFLDKVPADDDDDDDDCDDEDYSADYDDDCDDDDDDDDDCEDEDEGFEHGYFIFDPATANQVTRLHRTTPRAAIKSYFVNGLKHDFVRVPADKLKLSFDLEDSK